MATGTIYQKTFIRPSELFRVEKITVYSQKSIDSGSTYSDNFQSKFQLTGYTPIAFVGFQFAHGSGGTQNSFQSLYEFQFPSWIAVRNFSSNQSKTDLYVWVLFMKNI